MLASAGTLAAESRLDLAKRPLAGPRQLQRLEFVCSWVCQLHLRQKGPFPSGSFQVAQTSCRHLLNNGMGAV